MTLTNESVVELIKQQFGEKIISVEEPHGFLTLTVDKDINVELIAFVKANKTLKVNFMTDLCGIHYPDNKEKELGVIYHMHSFTNNFRFRIKCFIPSANPDIRTLTTVFPAANWMERETFDFYGIQFTGHPNLTRILNVDDMHYSPMLKQYPLEDGTREDKPDEYFGR